MASLEQTIEVLFAGKDCVSAIQSVAGPLTGGADSVMKADEAIREYGKCVRDSGMAIEDINKALYSALSIGIAYREALGNLNEA